MFFDCTCSLPARTCVHPLHRIETLSMTCTRGQLADLYISEGWGRAKSVQGGEMRIKSELVPSVEEVR